MVQVNNMYKSSYTFRKTGSDGDNITVSLTAEQITAIAAVDYDQLDIAEIIVVGITTLTSTAVERKQAADERAAQAAKVDVVSTGASQ
jgi:hypothetical protein